MGNGRGKRHKEARNLCGPRHKLNDHINKYVPNRGQLGEHKHRSSANNIQYSSLILALQDQLPSAHNQYAINCEGDLEHAQLTLG